MRRNNMTLVEWLIVGAIGTTIRVGGCNIATNNFLNPEKYTATATEKTVKRNGESDRYLVFTKLADGKIRVLQNTDAFFRGKFDSSDIYARLKQDQTYEFETVGYRIPFLSMYENILTAREVKPSQLEQTIGGD
jgi:hypothetical protein